MKRTVALQSTALAMGDVPGGLVNGNSFGSRSQAYLRMLARWRRTFLPALAFGRMLPPPRLTQRGGADTSGGACQPDERPTAVLVSEANGSGAALDTIAVTAPNKDNGVKTWNQPAVQASVWRTPDGKIQVLVVSSSAEADREVEIFVNLRWEFDTLPTSVTVVALAPWTTTGTLTAAVTSSGAVGLRLSVPSCGVGIFELTPAGAGGL